MKAKSIMNSTINNSEYNKCRKVYLEQKGLIRCSFCPYHKIENYDGKYYGTVINWRRDVSGVRYPNWKLVSKNKKQWIKKPLIIKKKNFKYVEDYYELFF